MRQSADWVEFCAWAGLGGEASRQQGDPRRDLQIWPSGREFDLPPRTDGIQSFVPGQVPF
jgi:hypothetical protein